MARPSADPTAGASPASQLKSVLPNPLILRADRIYARSGRQPRTMEAMALLDGRVVASGSIGEAYAAVGSDASELNLGDRCLLPAFCDAHIHLQGYALSRRNLWFEPEQSCEAVIERVAEAASSRPAGEWIIGRGWDHAGWEGWPHRSTLDRLTSAHPVALTRKDGHALWVNSAALRAADIDSDRADPEGGELQRDEAGALTGILLENAQRLVRGVVPEPSPAERRTALREAWPTLWREGIVAAHEMGAPGLSLWDDLVAMEAEGELGMRVHWYALRDAFDDALASGPGRRRRDDWLRLGGLKLFLDGTLGSQTAELLEPYEGSQACGIQTLSSHDLSAAVQQAAQVGLPCAMHAIGDAAVRRGLDAIERHGSFPARLGQSARHRIEHIQLLHPADLPRFHSLGVVASMQPSHMAADRDVADAFWGSRCELAYAWRSLDDSGALLAFGSDAPIERPDVRYGLECAVTRRGPDQRERGPWRSEQAVAVGTALAGYTEHAAKAVGRQGREGCLEAGAHADLVVMDRDPFDAAPDSLADLEILATMLDGGWVWQA